MPEINISALLDKYRKIVPTDVIIREVVTEALEKSGITVPKEVISYTNGTIHLDVHPLIKSKIMRQQDAIKREIEVRLAHSIHDLR